MCKNKQKFTYLMKRFTVLLMTILLCMACGKTPEEPKLGIRLAEGESSVLEFEGFASKKGVRLVADLNWMVRGADEEWFKVTPLYGEKGKVTISVEVEDYAGDESLEGSFEVVAGDAEVSIVVKQYSVNDPNSEYVFIPDTQFRAYLVENFDEDGDGVISKSEAASVESIECRDLFIESLEGIKSFTSLKKLDCAYNTIRGDLDLSAMTSLEEAIIHHNLYSSLNLAGCSSLVRVEANDNTEYTDDYRSIFYLQSVDVSGCEKLEYLELTDNAIEAIDLSECPALKVLRMTWNNLTTIDVSACKALTHLYVRKNTALAGTIDLSQNTLLEEVWCGESLVEGLNLGNDHSALHTLITYDSKISSLDLSTCPNLRKLEAHSMALTALDVTKCSKLEHLWLKFNKVSELDLTGCPMLTEVQIGYNEITSLDLSNSPLINILEAAANNLTEVNLSGCESLVTLSLQDNELETIDLKDCSILFQIDVARNRLKSLDLANKSELVVINFEDNELEELNIEGSPNITLLYGGGNNLRKLDLRRHTLLQEVLLSNNKLEELLVTNLQYMYQCEFNKNCLERLDLTGCVSVSELYVHDNPLAYFSVYPCAALRQLDMRRTAMKSIDLSNNPNAAFLFATENPQLETVYIAEDAEFSTLSVDDHTTVWYKAAGSYDDVNDGNWGDEDLDPWA